MDYTIDQLVEGFFLPLSIIIIGVGKADFSMITELDTDEKNLVDSNKRKSIRDLVQLFLFLKYESNPNYTYFSSSSIAKISFNIELIVSLYSSLSKYSYDLPLSDSLLILSKLFLILGLFIILMFFLSFLVLYLFFLF